MYEEMLVKAIIELDEEVARLGSIKYKEEVSIIEILNIEGLNLPNYQRPYKWERKHIRNLFYDIREAIEKDISVYRIGSIILHKKDNGEVNIVDGQQRLISICLFLLLYNGNANSLPVGAKNLLKCEYIGTSQFHAKENYHEWSILNHWLTREESDKGQQFNDYLLRRCRV